MKNYLKTLIALLLALATVFSFVACGDDDDSDGGASDNGGTGDTGSGDTGSGDSGSGDSAGGSTDSVPGGDVYDDEDDYLIRFVYSYTAKVKNSNGRTENKKEQKTVYTIALPLDNQGFTSEVLAEMNAISYHGYTFDKWYTSWDKTNQKPEGDEFVPGTTPITTDITLYGYREAKAGANATFKIETVYIDENGELTAPIATYPTPATDISDYEDLETSDVILTIDGTGAMFDFANANEIDIPWYKYASSVTKVVIGDGITTIGSNSFGGFTRLKTVEIGTGVAAIGESAFKDCTGKSFTKIDIPANVKTISKNAFYNTSLKEVSLRGVNYIEDSAFKNSNKIKQLLLIPGTMSDGKVLLKVAKDAFHPGTVGSSNNTHLLATGKIFYQGNAADFAALPTTALDDSARGVYFGSGNDVIFDNLDKKATSVVYSYEQDSENLPDGHKNGEGYWRYAEKKVGEENVITGIPIQYCFSVQYTISGNATPIATFYIPVSEKLDKNGNLIVDEEGVPELQALVERKHVDAQEALTYQGYKFATFTGGALVEGEYIQDDKILTCDRGTWLSDDGGIVFAKAENSETKEITITVSKDATVENKIIEDEKADFIYYYILGKYEAALEAAEDAKAEGELTDAEIQAVKDTYYSDFNHKTAYPKWVNEANVALAEALGNKNSDLNKAIAERLDKAFKIWDFESTAATQVIWTGSIAGVINIKTLIIGEGVEYIGNYAFNGLASVTNVVLPESLKGLNDSAFNGSAKLEYLYYNGTDASEIYYYHTTATMLESGVTVYTTAPVLDTDNNTVDITVKGKLGGTPAVVYTKYVAPADNTAPALGSYWCDVTEKKLAWTINEKSVTADNVTTVTHTLTVGGADEMVDFVSSDEAPWYWVGAKETVTAVTFKENLTKLGQNVLNGYAAVTELGLSSLNLRTIPANAFAGTDILENYDGKGYEKGILVVDGCLLNVDEARMNNKHLDVNYGVAVIAEGALARLDKLETVFFASSLLYINSGAFYNDANIKTVYTEVVPAAWGSSVTKDVNLTEATTFYNASSAPSADDENLYYYKNGNEFVVWGCSHVWGEWIVETESTCSLEGKMKRYCVYDNAHVDYESIEKSQAHNWGDWGVIPTTAEDAAHQTRTCKGCGISEKKYLEGVVTLESANNTVVLPTGQTNWFSVPYSESGFLVVELADGQNAELAVKHGSATYAAVTYKGNKVLGGKIFVPLNAINANEAFIGIDAIGDKSVTANISFISISDDLFDVLLEGENQTLTIAANDYQLVAFEYVDIGYFSVDNPGVSVGVLYKSTASEGGADEDPDIPGLIHYDVNIDIVGAGNKGIALLVLFNTTAEEANITVDVVTNVK